MAGFVMSGHNAHSHRRMDMNFVKSLGRHAVVPAAVAVVIGGAMGLSAAAHDGGAPMNPPVPTCAVSAQ